jgi:streptogramin lyase
MRLGRLVCWRRAVLGLAAGVGRPGLALRRRGLLRRLRGAVVLAGVPLLSLSLGPGVAGASVASASAAGSVRVYAGLDGPAGITAGPDGAMWFTNTGNSSIGRITTTGTVTDHRGPDISIPEGITAGPDGAL